MSDASAVPHCVCCRFTRHGSVKYAKMQHVWIHNVRRYTWMHWYTLTRWHSCSQDTLVFSCILWIRRHCCSRNAQDCCMLQFHTMVLQILDTQVHMDTLQYHTMVLQVLWYSGTMLLSVDIQLDDYAGAIFSRSILISTGMRYIQRSVVRACSEHNQLPCFESKRDS